MKTKPELDNMIVRSKLDNKQQLLEDKMIDFLSFIKSSSVLELDCGLGLISEHLSATNSVKLCEDGRLYFTYRRQLFPQSKVIEMNISPNALNTNYRIADYVIIHNNSFLNQAKKLAKKAVVLIHDMNIINIEGEKDETNIDSVEIIRKNTKNNTDKKSD